MSGQFTIRCFLVSGENYDIRVTNNETISALMEELSSMTGVPVENQMILLNGSLLDPSSTIESCKIQPGDSIHLTINVVGGY
ncbi:Ubiquitin family protein [Trichomonas vaginalis G3]|uniref:Ubiquitin family protein n=1 Tax=Trichomonas vaginalis (strain ATCC PRA-98 / G3) TaxID=412133 RepID=A2FVV6_TRIV3|nr:ubiquitin-like family [Trichomonas vaginalis G3]EAX90968.1 Ubiquitin family protein [Trichomonas vaginalis G3]KAI5490853.1 ubiquitin-like family [Trichomonas vaginalis G3]|eukprot:XP_001303898.1 Ubiquitin family protein [Trichomonas vaginalis G3]